jgi:hypothetical protein
MTTSAPTLILAGPCDASRGWELRVQPLARRTRVCIEAAEDVSPLALFSKDLGIDALEASPL